MDTKGYTVKVGREKDGSDAAAWDMETSFTKYGNDYKYAYIESCSHLNAADDDDCTTAVVCPDCGITITEAHEMHNVDSWTSNNDETCTADGTKYGFCTRCGKKVTETNTGSMHAHTMEHYETVPATCMTQGNVEYWHCSECNKNYASATGGETFNTVITDKNPDNHTGEIVWTKTATIHSSAYSCCNAPVVSEEAHEWENGVCSECGYECQHDGGSATCTDKAVCGICGEEYGEVNASNHTNLVKTEAKPATHMTVGNIEYWYCDGCDKYFSDEAGTKEIALKDTVVPKLTEHTADGTGWHSDETNHWNTCECGEKLNEVAHTFKWVTDKEATATEAGSKHGECTVCGYERRPWRFRRRARLPVRPRPAMRAISSSGRRCSCWWALWRPL